MSTFFKQIPQTVQTHLAGITSKSGLPEGDESIELMSQAWMDKKQAFEREIENNNMQEVDSLDKYDEQGAVVMTYSGSLINLGPLVNDVRNVEYRSIGIRTDVPDVAEHAASVLSHDLDIDQEVVFETGPVNSTSAVYKIAVPTEALDAAEQQEVLSNATMVLTQEFSNINKTVLLDYDE